MKKLFLLLVLQLSALLALDPPKPILGKFEGLTYTMFENPSLDLIYAFKLTPDWGVYREEINSDGSAHFRLFLKEKKDNGIEIFITKYANREDLLNAYTQIQSSFQNVENQTQNSFEAVLPNAWYSCSMESSYLIQTWYVVPKKKNKNTQYWQELKFCAKINDAEMAKSMKNLFLDPQPILESGGNGWIIKNPQQRLLLYALFPPKSYTNFLEGSLLNTDTKYSYLIKNEGLFREDYLYVKWNTKVNDEKAYKELLSIMESDLASLAPKNTFSKKGVIKANLHYAFREGSQYTIVIAAIEDFLVGYTYKKEFKDAENYERGLFEKLMFIRMAPN